MPLTMHRMTIGRIRKTADGSHLFCATSSSQRLTPGCLLKALYSSYIASFCACSIAFCFCWLITLSSSFNSESRRSFSRFSNSLINDLCRSSTSSSQNPLGFRPRIAKFFVTSVCVKLDAWRMGNPASISETGFRLFGTGFIGTRAGLRPALFELLLALGSSDIFLVCVMRCIGHTVYNCRQPCKINRQAFCERTFHGVMFGARRKSRRKYRSRCPFTHACKKLCRTSSAFIPPLTSQSHPCSLVFVCRRNVELKSIRYASRGQASTRRGPFSVFIGLKH